MAVRNILDYNGNIIGELELPDNTSEDVWETKLAAYAKPPAPTVIPDVTPRQMRQALILMGVSLSQIDTAIASLPEPTKSLAQVEWEYSVMFQRSRPLVAEVGQMLGWTSDQLDALWEFAATL